MMMEGPLSAEAATTARTYHVYDSFAKAIEIEAAWKDLSDREGDLFSSYDWCDTWWQNFHKGRRLEIHAMFAGGRLVGIAPLFRETLWMGLARLRTVRLLASDFTIDGAGLAVEPAFAEEFARALLDHLTQRGPWDVLHLGPLRSYITAAESMADVFGSHEQVQSVLIGRQNDWQTVFELPDTYDAYLHTLSGDERRDTQRRLRKLQEEHDVRTEAIHNPHLVTAAMDTLIQLHQQLWTGKGQRGQFVDWPGFEAFHRQAAARLAQQGRLLLVTLSVDDQIVGAAYGYHSATRSHAMIRGYRDDDPWRRFALGRILHCKMVQEAIEHGSSILDDGRGVFEYKLRLAGKLRGERSVTVVQHRAISGWRFWISLRTAYAIHVIYNRLWRDTLATRLGLVRPLRPFYIRRSFLAHLFRQSRFKLLRSDKKEELRGADLPPGFRSSYGK